MNKNKLKVNAMSIVEENDELLYEIRTQNDDFEYFRNRILISEKALVLDVPEDSVQIAVDICIYYDIHDGGFLCCFYDDLLKWYMESIACE